jgi:hypothetical protein
VSLFHSRPASGCVRALDRCANNVKPAGNWAADGEHFNKLCDLGDAADVSTSYPTIVRSADGDFHLIYTYGGRSLIKYVHLPREWVQQRIAVTCLGRENR